MVATTVYETENCGGDNITPGEDVKVGQTLTSGWGCRCEANTNVPGAPRILDPPLCIVVTKTLALIFLAKMAYLLLINSSHCKSHTQFGCLCCIDYLIHNT